MFLLADVFAVPFDEIAGVVERSPEACRQVASRARRRVREERPRFRATDEEAWRVAAAFLEAVQAGNIDGVLGLLAPDAVAISDGGARSPCRPPPGARRRPGRPAGDEPLRPGHPGHRRSRCGGQRPTRRRLPARGRAFMATRSRWSTAVAGIYSVVNPDKLAAIDRRRSAGGDPAGRCRRRGGGSGGGAGTPRRRGPASRRCG